MLPLRSSLLSTRAATVLILIFFNNGGEKSALNENESSGLTPVQELFPEHLELRTRK
jgi:hypothetical protein